MTSTQKPTNPLFTRQALVALLLPLIAEQALSVTIGLADTLMVSSVGEAAVSGVSLVDSFNTLMIQVMSALATGGAVVTSQYIGHREPKNAKAAAAQILFVLASFSLVVAAVVVVGRHAILRVIFGSIDADVMRYAETYFLLSALSYPFIGLYNAGAALFRAQGNSKISMLSSLVMNVINIGGNAVLIFGFGMGVLGAALASLVSRAVACVVVLYLLQKPACPLRVDGLRALAPDGGLIRRILRVGIPAGIENGMFQIGKLSVSSLLYAGHGRHCGQRRGQHHHHLFEHPGQRRGHGRPDRGGPVPWRRGEGAGRVLLPPPAAHRLLRCLGHEPFCLPVCQPVRHFPVQPLAGGTDHGPAGDGVVQLCVPVLLAVQLHPAQHPARRRRRPVYHGREHPFHVGVPGGLLLCDGAGLPRPSALHLDGHVPGLGVPLAVLLRALCTGPVDGTERHLTPCVFQAVCTLCGVRAVFLFCPVQENAALDRIVVRRFFWVPILRRFYK